MYADFESVELSRVGGVEWSHVSKWIILCANGGWFVRTDKAQNLVPRVGEYCLTEGKERVGVGEKGMIDVAAAMGVGMVCMNSV